VTTIRARGLDHIVLRCRDVERTLGWYCDMLGLAGERVDSWRAGETFFPSARVDAGTIIDFFPVGDADATASETNSEAANLDHVCLVIEPTDLAAIAASGAFEVVDGPATRWGARGDGTSLYVRDPEGNVVELRYYGDA
jgi:catechol 2,3-dioxygenase-like lactoylglutathione lyase family enzyme